MSKKQPIPFGKYLLLERVNIGGMAEVWKAKTFGAEGFEKLVAIKRILPNIAEDEEFISMFIDEAKISVQLTHANIAQVFDLGKIGDSYYIAMEYVSGKDMRAIFDKARKRGEPAPIPLTCYCLSKASEGLDYAHRKRDAQGNDLNIVHRDVSPQNILCSFDGETKVIDFGIAKAANKATKTQAGILKGKFGYMSPEQVRGLPLDRRSDVFALGVVLYEMLTGERLFVGESDFSVLEKVRAVDILPPSNYNRRIPAALEKIVLRALAKDVEDRFQYASELGDELQRFLITNDTIFSRKDLMQFMKSTFAEDVEREKLKLAEYSEVKLPPGMAALAGVPQMGNAPLPPRVSGVNIPVVAPPQPRAPAPEIEAPDVLAESPTNAGQPPMVPGPPVRANTGSAPRMTGNRPAVAPPTLGTPRPGTAPGPRPAPPFTPGRAMTGSAPRLSNGTGIPAARPPQTSGSRPPPVPPGANFAADIGAALDDELDDATVAQPSRGKAASSAQDPSATKGKSKLPLVLGAAALVALLALGGAAFMVLGHATGTLLLNCSPSDDLVILIDGQSVGTSTPFMNPKIAVGPHSISITAKGYDIERRQFSIEKQQTHIEDVQLKKRGSEPSAAARMVAAAIVRATAGAEVTLDGKVVIAKDAEDATFVGEVDGAVAHVVTARLEGYQPFSKSFAAGTPVKVTAALQKTE